jgi:hypothetical protein
MDRLVAEFKSAMATAEKDQLTMADYKSLPLNIMNVSKNDLGLSRERVESRSQLKLRAAKISPQEWNSSSPVLTVEVDVVGGAFKVEVEFYRPVVWDLPGNKTGSSLVPVWHDGTFGTHGRDLNYVLNALDEIMEKFLNAYLKANQ